MKESSYGSQLKAKLVTEVGGLMWKISDRSTLGLPDNIHVNKGFATFIETKEFSTSGTITNPFDYIDDLRQFEVCRRIGKVSLVLYAMYFSEQRKTLIMSPDELQAYRVKATNLPEFQKVYVVRGHGVDIIKLRMEEYYYGHAPKH